MIPVRPSVLLLRRSALLPARSVFQQVFYSTNTSTTTTSTTTSTSNNHQSSYQSLDATPIEFLSNLTTPAFAGTSKLAKALSCTTDISSAQKLETSHIPFEVKTKTKSDTTTTTTTITDKRALSAYVSLSKPRLTALVVLSAICSYALTPFNATVPQLLFLTIGTTLCSASANAINQGREPEFDKLMNRTVARPIVRGLLTPEQAYKFAAMSGTLGTAILYLGVNETVAVLGALNIILYGWIYTSLKRKHIVNTWVGAIVGAIPPLMGWAASSPLTHPGAWCLAALLYAWQFPHFNALSHNIKNEYQNAGYVMTCFKNPRLNARVGFRYALLMFPICFGLTYWGVTDSVFPWDSAVLNCWMAYWSCKFWYQERVNYKNGRIPTSNGLKLASIYAKKTFWASVWHLPGVLILAMLHKKGRWDWLFGKGGYLEY